MPTTSSLEDRMKLYEHYESGRRLLPKLPVMARAFSTDEIDKLPPQHAARTNPDLRVERSEHAVIDMPIFSRVINKTKVLFNGDEPVTGPDDRAT